MADRSSGRKRPLFTLSQGEDSRGREPAPENEKEDSLGLQARAERSLRDERVDRIGRDERVDRIGREERTARLDRVGRAEPQERASREERPEPRRRRVSAETEDARPVRVVDIDIPFTSIAYLFIKLLIVLIPFVVAMAVALRFIWKLVAG